MRFFLTVVDSLPTLHDSMCIEAVAIKIMYKVTFWRGSSNWMLNTIETLFL